MSAPPPSLPVAPWSASRPLDEEALGPRPRVSDLPSARRRVLFALGCLVTVFAALLTVLSLGALRDVVVLSGVLAVHATLGLAYVADQREWLAERLDDGFLAHWDALLLVATTRRAPVRVVRQVLSVRDHAQRVARVHAATGLTSTNQLRDLVTEVRLVHATLTRTLLPH